MQLSPLYWTPEDALALRCSVEQVGCLRALPLREKKVTSDPDLRADVDAARRIAPWALLHLARLATGEGRAAVEACRLILDRAYGPPAPAAMGVQAPALPDFIDKAQRLTYGRADDEVSTNGGDAPPVNAH